MSQFAPPTVVIRFDYEAPPRVTTIAGGEGEQQRLLDWVDVAHPEYGRIIRDAYALEKEAKAA